MFLLNKILKSILLISILIFLFGFFSDFTYYQQLLNISAIFIIVTAFSEFLMTLGAKNTKLSIALRSFFFSIVCLFTGFVLSSYSPYSTLEPILLKIGGFFLAFSLIAYSLHLTKESKYKEKINNSIGWFFLGFALIMLVIFQYFGYQASTDSMIDSFSIEWQFVFIAFFLMIIFNTISLIFFIYRLRKEKGSNNWWGLSLNIILLLGLIVSYIVLF